MNLGLKGRKELVTGGSRGIGRECALSLAREGASVCINYVSNEAAAEQTRQDLLALGVPAHSQKADVTNVQAARGLDVLAHSTGISISADGKAGELDVWHRLIDSLVHSTYYLCDAAAGPMRNHR